MIYERIKQAKFIARINRFTAYVDIDGKQELCHVKNTGRCRELFIEGVPCFVQEADNPNRKTQYDLIALYKGDKLINVDSQIPNKAVAEWLAKGILLEGITLIRQETTYGNSRFDFYVEAGERKVFIEVKGVTLEENGHSMFPDAPTERGVKHLNELIKAVEDGFESCVIFVIQMADIQSFRPNGKTHKEFEDTLRLAQGKGVKVLAYECNITENSIELTCEVPVILKSPHRT